MSLLLFPECVGEELVLTRWAFTVVSVRRAKGKTRSHRTLKVRSLVKTPHSLLNNLESAHLFYRPNHTDGEVAKYVLIK